MEVVRHALLQQAGLLPSASAPTTCYATGGSSLAALFDQAASEHADAVEPVQVLATPCAHGPASVLHTSSTDGACRLQPAPPAHMALSDQLDPPSCLSSSASPGRAGPANSGPSGPTWQQSTQQQRQLHTSPGYIPGTDAQTAALAQLLSTYRAGSSEAAMLPGAASLPQVVMVLAPCEQEEGTAQGQDVDMGSKGMVEPVPAFDQQQHAVAPHTFIQHVLAAATSRCEADILSPAPAHEREEVERDAIPGGDSAHFNGCTGLHSTIVRTSMIAWCHELFL